MNKEYKRSILKFLLSKKEEQPILFREIIDKEMLKIIDFHNSLDEFGYLTEDLNDEIYYSKLKELDNQTRVLKEQIISQSNGTKHNSALSIMERKIYIVTLQIEIGVYKLYKK